MHINLKEKNFLKNKKKIERNKEKYEKKKTRIKNGCQKKFT